MKIGNFELRIGKRKSDGPDAGKQYTCWTCKRKWKYDDHVDYLWHIHYCCADNGADAVQTTSI
ncbi:MAG: hypothetical protein KGH61_02985 [Candidatus Micrarchaeota archaeon]|nr:hypothetical protein [Candidatus Micrarchaeota archaeon]MDE1847888.1 hypothetical protein [Candidatus Micrarchaeota archaeon]MDE1864514.1 hypothetical protein [Candidatus Micrarchaeota archaeon]